MTEREFVDFATVRDKLLEAIERRGEISYEQTMALQHAEWKASASGHPSNEIKTDPAVFSGLFAELMENEKLKQYPDCLLYTSPSPRDQRGSRMPSSA